MSAKGKGKTNNNNNNNNNAQMANGNNTNNNNTTAQPLPKPKGGKSKKPAQTSTQTTTQTSSQTSLPSSPFSLSSPLPQTPSPQSKSPTIESPSADFQNGGLLLEEKSMGTIVLQLGSDSIRVGLVGSTIPFEYTSLFLPKSTSSLPISVPSLIARLRSSPPPPPPSSSLSDEMEEVNEKEEKERKEREHAILSLKKFIQIPTDPPARPSSLSGKIEERSDQNELPKRKVYIGNDVIKLLQHPALARDYEIIQPIKRGQLHIGMINGEYHSAQSISFYLIELLTIVFERFCGIKKLMLSSYRLILLVPDQFLKRDLKLLLKLFFCDFSFQAVIVHQESVCATLAAGVHSACVVDIGHQKIAVSCVEEGLSLPSTRITLNYGGEEIEEFISYLLCNSPNYKLISPPPSSSPLTPSSFTPSSIRSLKQSLCHLDLKDRSVNKQYELVIKGDKYNVKYNLTLNEELILAPMAFFYPEVLNKNRTTIKTNAQFTDYEDLFATSSFNFIRNQKKKQEELAFEGSGLEYISIDQAIIESIKRLEVFSQQQKVLSNILLIGGSSSFPSLQNVLEKMIKKRVPEGTNVEFVNIPPEMTAFDLSWHGAAIVSSLPSCRELWMARSEWTIEEGDVRKIREKAVFEW